MGIVDLFEIGFFMAFWNWSNPILTLLVYFCVMIGSVLQILLQKKCRRSIMKCLLIGIYSIGIIISECLWHTITGWDRLAVDFVYGFVVCLWLGAVITMIASAFSKRKK